MEKFSDLIRTRRSMRKFTSEELTQEEVVSLLKAALMAPTSKRSNSWQFIAVDDKACLERLSHCKKAGADFLKDAALAVVVLPADEYVREVLDIPLQLQVLSIIAIGHKGMERKPFDEKHLQWEKIHINKYGGK